MATEKSFKKESPEKIKQQIRYKRDKDREKVRGIFKFYEVPGGQMSFMYRAYSGDPLERYDFVDGEIYTIPLGVAKHLTNNCWYPVHEYSVDEAGNKDSIRIGKKAHRCTFQSLEFVDIEGLEEPADILTVEKVPDGNISI